MKKAPTPENEFKRLMALRRYEILDTELEEDFDNLTKIAATICGTKIALVSLIDSDRQWFKSHYGLDAKETPRDISYCGHAIMSDEILVVNDASKDERFCDNPLLTGEPHVRFYVGCPLITPDQYRIGTLCVIDTEPKELSQSQLDSLKIISKNVVSLLTHRLNNIELLTTKRQLQDVEKISSTGGWQLDLETSDVSWTDEVYRIYQIEIGTPTNMFDGLQNYDEESRIKLEGYINRCISDKTPFDDVFSFRDNLGVFKWVRSVGRAIEEHGKIRRIIGTFQDVTESKRRELVESSIKSIREKYILLNGDHKSFYKFSFEVLQKLCRGKTGGIIRSNSSLESYSIITGHDLSYLFSDKSVIDPLLESVLSGEYSVANKDSMEVLSIPLYISDSDCLVYIVGSDVQKYDRSFFDYIQPVTQVITEMIAYLKLEESKSEKDYERNVILESTGVALWAFYPLEKRIDWDQSMYNLWEIREDDYSSNLEAWEKLLHPADKARALGEFIDTMKFRDEYETSFRIITKLGKIKYIKTKANVVRGEDGRAIKILGVNWDFTNDITIQKQLIESKEKAENSEKVKSDFLANMSHEIRTPMNGILGMISLLSGTKLNEEQQDMLKTIQSSGDILMTLLNDILDLSKIDAGKFELEIVNFNIKECIDNTLFLFSSICSEKGINLLSNIDPSMPRYLKGDVTRIRQILINFLSNAIKFTHTGDVNVSVSARELSEESLILLISVADSGIGIKKDAQSKMFEAFSQADSSITRNYGGTGLGLSICSSLVKLMDGQISLESEEDTGSTFTVELPLLIGEKSDLVSNDSEAHEDNTSLLYSKRFPHKILVVEDNIVNQKIATMMLKKLGYDCTLVNNGKEAIDLLESKSGKDFTLIFMDMQMPVLDGISATKYLVGNFGKKVPPIVAMTANILETDREKCFDAGMVDYISKPIKIEDLKRILSLSF